MKIDVDSPLDSYSLAAMARTEDALSFLIQDLGVVGSKEAFKNVLYGVRLVVEGKNRRLTDFSEIVKMEEGKSSARENKDRFIVNVFREEIIPNVTKIIKEAGFKTVERIKNSTQLCIKIPEPNHNQLIEFSGEVKRIERAAISRIARIKSDAVQRIKSALEREYIEPHLAVPAKSNLEDIQKHAVKNIKLIGLRKRKSILGNFFSYADEEERRIGQVLEKSSYRNLF